MSIPNLKSPIAQLCLKLINFIYKFNERMKLELFHKPKLVQGTADTNSF